MEEALQLGLDIRVRACVNIHKQFNARRVSGMDALSAAHQLAITLVLSDHTLQSYLPASELVVNLIN